MSTIITIRFQKKNIYEDVFNCVLIAVGCLLFYFVPQFLPLGSVFFVWGIYPFSKSKGVMVDPNQHRLWSYNAYLWIKNRKEISLTNIESVMVTTGTQSYVRQSMFINSNSRLGFMVYKLYLLSSTYSKKEMIHLGDFWTKEECMQAAEELSKTSLLPLVLRIR